MEPRELDEEQNAAEVATEPRGAHFSASTVCRLVGVSNRQLDYWARTGLANPSIYSNSYLHEWLYSFGDVVGLRIVKRLLDAGVSLQRIREIVTYLRHETAGGVSQDMTLLSDGKQVYACHSRKEVMDALGRGALFGIAVGRVWTDTETDVAHLPTKQQ